MVGNGDLRRGDGKPNVGLREFESDSKRRLKGF